MVDLYLMQRGVVMERRHWGAVWFAVRLPSLDSNRQACTQWSVATLPPIVNFAKMSFAKQHLVGFEPKHVHLPDPMLTTYPLRHRLPICQITFVQGMIACSGECQDQARMNQWQFSLHQMVQSGSHQ
ncbi:hypothetical protein E2C01_026077 [Portunus trituberculatus]|uniref:Uncharacterized protein n=1 Tax=Portunus trituberculatus TaxID=210409 RepID=A0A5B7EHF0_PORTR|nr:hypothetical protein [Portunus trituberculatus]